LTVLIVNYNAWADVERLVLALFQAPEVSDGRSDVVVVDNASEGPVPASLSESRRGYRLVLREQNGGFAAGVNTGLRSARGPWVLLLNPDVETHAGLIGQVLARLDTFQDDPRGAPGVVGFGLLNPDRTRQPSVGAEPGLIRSLWEAFIPRSRRKYQAEWRTRAGEVPWVTGACALVDARLLDSLGGMDEDFFLYYEEVALCHSARKQGRRVEFDPSIEVVHLRPLQNRPVTPLLRVITRHSKLLYFRKHLPGWQFRVLAQVISAESLIRGLWSRVRGRREEAKAWQVIHGMTRWMRRGIVVRGRGVLELAEEAISTPSEPIKPVRHRFDLPFDRFSDTGHGRPVAPGAERKV
jgi:GT2 family glycosyltransferase